jgi:hypothetical protein
MKRERSSVIDALLKSEEPSVRWKALVRVAGEDPESLKVRELREEIRTSPRARALIAGELVGDCGCAVRIARGGEGVRGCRPPRVTRHGRPRF